MKLPFALALLLPLAACAAQPAAPAGSAAPAAPGQPAVQAPAPRQQDAGAQDSTMAPAAPRQDAPALAPALAPAAPASATATPARIPAAERATTVGEVPAATGVTTPAPGAAGMPAAPAAIPATPANPARMPQAVSGPSAAPSAGSLLQTILALALVLALLAALAWAMKRYGPRMSGNSANLRMVGALNIGGRERIMVVEVGDQWIVVGASPGRVNALATMPKGEATPATATLAGHTPSAATFADWLKQTIDKRNAK